MYGIEVNGKTIENLTFRNPDNAGKWVSLFLNPLECQIVWLG